jgi:tight adherence protein B
VAAVVYAAGTRETALSRLHARYVAHLDDQHKRLFRAERGVVVARLQLLLLGALLVAHVAAALPYAWLAALLVAAGPALYLRSERRARVARLEQQVDGFVVALANSLKTVPSPAAALQATAAVLPQPTRQEVELVQKEMRVGRTLEEALLSMSTRAESRSFDVALSAVLIGLRVGGNLPVVLERTAATLREMNRLLGVVRTKTGEGRMQLWVLAAFPAVIAFALNAAKPGYFDPLQSSVVGQLAVGAAVVLWLSALLLARKVLAVDV